MNKTILMKPPLPDTIDWTGLIKWAFASICSLLGFIGGVDMYFKYLKEKKIEHEKTMRRDKEEFIRGVVSASVKVAVEELREDVRELKAHREADMKNLNDHLIKIYAQKK